MLSLTVVIGVLFVTVACYYLKYAYFVLRGPIPGIPPQFLVGNLLQTGMLWGDQSMIEVLYKLQGKFGDVFQYFLWDLRLIVISSLEDINHIYAHRHLYEQSNVLVKRLDLVNSSEILGLTGAKYKRHVSVSYPLFRGNKILMHFDTIINCTDKLLARWREIDDPTKIYLNMNEQTQQLLLDIFGFIASDYDLHTLDNECEKGKKELVRAMDAFLDMFIRVIDMPLIIGHIYLFFNFKYQRARRIIDQYIQRMIDQELAKSAEIRAERKRTSLISSLVSALQHDEKLEATKAEEHKKGLSRQELMGLVLSYILAEYTTVSTVLAWFIHLMSKYPEIQSKIKKELSEYQCLSNEQLDSLVYLDCVLREVLRFAPAALGSMRTLTADDRLPKSGFHLRKGEQILISFYNLAHDPRYWSNPDQFYPERVLNETERGKNNRAASIPFGGGHRICPGQDLAKFELKVICARLMQHVTFIDGGPEVNSGGYQERERYGAAQAYGCCD